MSDARAREERLEDIVIETSEQGGSRRPSVGNVGSAVSSQNATNQANTTNTAASAKIDQKVPTTESKAENRMMQFFNQEFLDKKIDFKPKKSLADPKAISDDIRKTLKNVKIYDKLIEIEKIIDEKMYKTRVIVQENFMIPSPKLTACLRTHIFSSFTKMKKSELSSSAENDSNIKKLDEVAGDENGVIDDNMLIDDEEKESLVDVWVLRIQGKLIPPRLHSKEAGLLQKFSSFIKKIEILFYDKDNKETAKPVIWVRHQGFADVDGFEIKRQGSADLRARIFLHMSSSSHEYKISKELSEVLGLKQDTKSNILHSLWQYIKMNRLQDVDNSNIVINNRELQSVFKCEKMDITSLSARLVDHLKSPEPVEISYNIINDENWDEHQKLFDIFVNIDDPNIYSLGNFLSNADEESLLFPKSLFFNKSEHSKDSPPSLVDSYYQKISEYDSSIADLLEKLKKHKHKHDFYDAYTKDPVKFINNFLIQQNSLLKIMKDESAIMDSRWDYQSSQYYKDYEDVLKDHVDQYLGKTGGSK